MPKRPVVPNAKTAANVVSDEEQTGPLPESTPPLPDLSGVDLHTLRRTPLDAHSDLAAAVAHRLRNPRGEEGGWHNGGDENPQPQPKRGQAYETGLASGAGRPPGRRRARRRQPGP